MQCPIDGTTLVIADRSGVEIDYCPQCRGVWLDRGELDKIIERAGTSMAPPPQQQQSRDHEPRYHEKPRKKKSMGGFLEDIFDF